MSEASTIFNALGALDPNFALAMSGQMQGDYGMPMMNPYGVPDLNSFAMLNSHPGLNLSNPYDHGVNYYGESCKLYIANVVLTNQIKELIAERNELMNRLGRLERRTTEEGVHSKGMAMFGDKKKRHRRTAKEIARRYICPVEGCQKSYGSEGSMTQHLKLKHPEVDYKQFLARANAAEDGVKSQE